MSAPLFTVRESLISIRSKLVFTHAALLAEPLADKWAPTHAALIAEATQLITEEMQLTDAVTVADVACLGADRRLDPVVTRLHTGILERTGRKRTVPLYQRYFGKRPLRDVVRPVLGLELAWVKDIAPSLVTSTDAGLKALGTELGDRAKDGDKAEAAWETAQRALADFRKIGKRKAFVDKANQARQALWGSLAELVHARPELLLGAGYADTFFDHDSGGAPTVVELRDEVAALKDKLATTEQRLASVVKLEQEAAAARKAAAQAKDEAEAQDAEQQIVALQARVLELRGRHTPPPSPPSA